MPKLYEYFGITIFFYSNEHEPIHVHGRHQGKESKAEILVEEGEVIEIRITTVPGKKPLESSQFSDFRSFVEHYAEEIIQRWVDYFVYNRKIAPERITRRIR